jgi:hypothetical protein
LRSTATDRRGCGLLLGRLDRWIGGMGVLVDR